MFCDSGLTLGKFAPGSAAVRMGCMGDRTPRSTLKRLLLATGAIAVLLGGLVCFGDALRHAQIKAVRHAYDYDRLTRDEARYYVGDVVASRPEPNRP